MDAANNKQAVRDGSVPSESSRENKNAKESTVEEVKAMTNAASPRPSQTSSKLVPTTTSTNGKVKVHFVAVGSAPLMKKTKFQVGAEQRFSFVITFLRRMLKLGNSGDSLFLYVNSAFVPSPDEMVGDLNDCFSVRGELMVHYSLQEAWG